MSDAHSPFPLARSVGVRPAPVSPATPADHRKVRNRWKLLAPRQAIHPGKQPSLLARGLVLEQETGPQPHNSRQAPAQEGKPPPGRRVEWFDRASPPLTPFGFEARVTTPSSLDDGLSHHCSTRASCTREHSSRLCASRSSGVSPPPDAVGLSGVERVARQAICTGQSAQMAFALSPSTSPLPDRREEQGAADRAASGVPLPVVDAGVWRWQLTRARHPELRTRCAPVHCGQYATVCIATRFSLTSSALRRISRPQREQVATCSRSRAGNLT